MWPGVAGADDSAVTLYENATKEMAEQPEPTYVAYRLDGSSDEGMEVYLVREDNSLVWIHEKLGSSPSTWYVLHRESDFANAILDEGRAEYQSSRSFFDPTWYGAYHALRDGMFFYARPKSIGEQPTQAVIPTPPTPIPSSLRVIATVAAMGAGVYIIRDAGSTNCENGDPGRAVTLTARSSPDEHQLTYAVIDLKLTKFCTLRFTQPDHHRASGTVYGLALEQHYANVGGYWVQTDGVLYWTVPELPFGHITRDWHYRLSGTTFPREIPDDAFALSH